VLLRGLARSSEHWGDFAARFRGAFPGARVDTPDLPGFGAHRGLRAPGTVAETLAAVRAEVGADGAIWLLGLSLGGMVAFEWARRHREEVAGAVLINTSLGGCSPPWRRLHPSAVLRLVGAMGTVDPAARERIVFALNSNQPELAEATVERWAALARTHAPLRANVLRQVMAAARYRPAVEAVAPPLLILTSRGDHMVDSSCSRVVAGRLPGAVLQVHPTAGHDLPLDDPQWVLTRIAEWLPARRSSEK